MKERYLFLKVLFPNYIIRFYSKEKYHYILDDKLIIDTFGYKKLNKVNKITVDNMDITQKEEHDENEYDDFLAKAKLIEYLQTMKKGV